MRGTPDVLIDASSLHTRTRLRGIGRYITDLLAALSALDTPLHLATLRALAPGHAPIGGLALPEHFTDVAEWRHKLRRRALLARARRDAGARLLHLPDPYGTPVGPTPRVVTCLDLIPLRLPAYRRAGPIGWAVQALRDRVRYLAPRRILAISEATRADLMELVGVPGERIDVTPLGVDHARFHPRADPTGEEQAAVHRRVGSSAEYLVYVGGGDARKNLPMLVEAFARSRARRHVRLVIAGSLGDARSHRLEQLARERGVGDAVELLGYVDDAIVPALYRHALAHVFPSTYEGFGLTVLEAMACGTPTIAHRVSSIGEVGGDALLYASEPSAGALAEAIDQVADDASLRAELRQRGVAQAARFTWSACARATLAAYERALHA